MFDYTRQEILAALNESSAAETVKASQSHIESLKANPLLKNAFEDLNKVRDYYRVRPLYSIPFSMFKRYEEDGDRTEFEYAEKGYFRHRGHLKVWGIGAILDPSDEDITMLEDTIWAICDEYTWALPAHMNGNQGIYVNYQPNRYTIDLFAAETGQAIAEILLYLGDRLNPLVVQRAKREVFSRIIDRYIDGDKSDFWWHTGENNWSAVCAGSVGMAGICAITDNERLATLLEQVLTPMRTFMSGFSSDGACLEGLGYWQYGFGYFACYADMLYRRTNGKINLFDDELVELVAKFTTKMFFYGSRTVSFSDGSDRGSIWLGMCNLLAKHYPDIVIPATANLSAGIGTSGCHRFALELRQYIWVESTERPGVSDELKIYPFPAAQWYVANGSDDIGFAAKAGNNGEPHNHNDLGHFIVYKKGVEFFADLGSGEYNKAYFGSGRYDTWHCGSQGHSVPIINGKLQRAGRGVKAINVNIDDGGISMDIKNAYNDDTLVSCKREFAFTPDPAQITFTDRFTFTDAPENLIERFVSRLNPQFGKGKFTLANGDDSVTLYYDETLFDASAEAHETPDHGGRPFTFYTIDLTVKAPEKDMSFTFNIK